MGKIYSSAHHPTPVPTPELWDARATPQGRRGYHNPATTSVGRGDYHDPTATFIGSRRLSRSRGDLSRVTRAPILVATPRDRGGTTIPTVTP